MDLYGCSLMQNKTDPLTRSWTFCDMYFKSQLWWFPLPACYYKLLRIVFNWAERIILNKNNTNRFTSSNSNCILCLYSVKVVFIGTFLVLFCAFSYSGVYFCHSIQHLYPTFIPHKMDKFKDQLTEPLFVRNL